MSVETEKFRILDVQWDFRQSNEITGNAWPNPSMRSSVRAVSVECKKCGFVWVASEGDGEGEFQRSMAAIFITCSNCGVHEVVRIASLEGLPPNIPG